ncbi:unnamed protein product [Closterium sp. NIES-54]
MDGNRSVIVVLPDGSLRLFLPDGTPSGCDSGPNAVISDEISARRVLADFPHHVLSTDPPHSAASDPAARPSPPLSTVSPDSILVPAKTYYLIAAAGAAGDHSSEAPQESCFSSEALRNHDRDNGLLSSTDRRRAVEGSDDSSDSHAFRAAAALSWQLSDDNTIAAKSTQVNDFKPPLRGGSPFVPSPVEVSRRERECGIRPFAVGDGGNSRTAELVAAWLDADSESDTSRADVGIERILGAEPSQKRNHTGFECSANRVAEWTRMLEMPPRATLLRSYSSTMLGVTAAGAAAGGGSAAAAAAAGGGVAEWSFYERAQRSTQLLEVPPPTALHRTRSSMTIGAADATVVGAAGGVAPVDWSSSSSSLFAHQKSTQMMVCTMPPPTALHRTRNSVTIGSAGGGVAAVDWSSLYAPQKSTQIEMPFQGANRIYRRHTTGTAAAVADTVDTRLELARMNRVECSIPNKSGLRSRSERYSPWSGCSNSGGTCGKNQGGNETSYSPWSGCSNSDGTCGRNQGGNQTSYSPWSGCSNSGGTCGKNQGGNEASYSPWSDCSIGKGGCSNGSNHRRDVSSSHSPWGDYSSSSSSIISSSNGTSGRSSSSSNGTSGIGQGRISGRSYSTSATEQEWGSDTNGCSSGCYSLRVDENTVWPPQEACCSPLPLLQTHSDVAGAATSMEDSTWQEDSALSVEAASFTAEPQQSQPRLIKKQHSDTYLPPSLYGSSTAATAAGTCAKYGKIAKNGKTAKSGSCTSRVIPASSYTSITSASECATNGGAAAAAAAAAATPATGNASVASGKDAAAQKHGMGSRRSMSGGVGRLNQWFLGERNLACAAATAAAETC